MKMNKQVVMLGLLLLAMVVSVTAGDRISEKKARNIGEYEINRLIAQSYHYRIEYDTVVCVPVHSKTVWKNDFYLLYFLHEDQFQAEMEVDAVTGDAALLAIDEMGPPYLPHPSGLFRYRFFDPDSIAEQGYRYVRGKVDSVRLVYFGVIPKLGKRGVIWEVWGADGPVYIHINGAKTSISSVVNDLNSRVDNIGSIVVDSIQLREYVNTVERLRSMTPEELTALDIQPPEVDSLIVIYKDSIETIYKRFPRLRKFIYLEEDAPPARPSGGWNKP